MLATPHFCYPILHLKIIVIIGTTERVPKSAVCWSPPNLWPWAKSSIPELDTNTSSWVHWFCLLVFGLVVSLYYFSEAYFPSRLYPMM